MNIYSVSIQNHYVTSETKQVNANSEEEAKLKARELFSYSGLDKSIKVTIK